MMIAIAMMSYTMARGLASGEPFEVEAFCRFTRELDLDAVDWATTYEHQPTEIRRFTDDYGLRNVCYSFFCDLNYPTPVEREAGRQKFRRGLEIAAILGADKVMLPCPGKPGLSREESFRNFLSGLQEVIPLAQAAGITVTVEHFPDANGPFITSRDLNRAVTELPELRVTFDSGNPLTGGERAADAFRRSAAHVVHAHFKDWRRCAPNEPGATQGLDGNWRRGELVGDGEVDNAEAARAMREYSYQGYVDFEYEGLELTPQEACRKGIPRMREWLGIDHR